MAVAYSYPGVYIIEAPSFVHTIVGVPTAITAIVGIAQRGPLNEPVAIQSPGDYARIFGGDGSLPLDQAMTLFFQNGGGQAIVVRIGAAGMPVAKATIKGVNVAAASPGQWGANLAYTIDEANLTDAQKGTLYNLTITLLSEPKGRVVATELFPRVSTDTTSPRSLANVLAGSALVAIDTSPVPATTGSTSRSRAASTTSDTTDTPSDPSTTASSAMTAAVAPTPFTIASGGDAAPTEADLYSASDDQIGFQAVVKHNSFFNLLVLMPVTAGTDLSSATLSAAAAFARDHRAMLLVDPPQDWTSITAAVDGRDEFFAPFGTARDNAAIYFPNLQVADTSGATTTVGPAAAVAGLYAATDAARGVWKAPAGIGVQLGGITDLAIRMSDSDNGRLNPLAVNCLRSLPTIGNVVWGARTMNGDDLSASQWKYVPVRRLALFIEESLYRGTQWVVFEPNDEPLWAQVRLNVGTFMHTLFRQGAFAGQTAKDAYFVQCDSSINPQADIDRGILNVTVGFAPLKPAEFVVVTIQQISGDLQV